MQKKHEIEKKPQMCLVGSATGYNSPEKALTQSMLLVLGDNFRRNSEMVNLEYLYQVRYIFLFSA